MNTMGYNMDFDNLEQLRQQHVSGRFIVENNISVGGIDYHLVRPDNHLHTALIEQNNQAIVYKATNPDQIIENNSDQWLALVYCVENNAIIPADVKGITPDNIVNEENKIGDTVNVEIMNLPSAPTVRATVDTGATYSSLHADKWEVKGQQVHFVSKTISDNVVRVPLETQQAVKSPGDDVEYRPVVSLNLRINGEVIKDQLFNLSDRGEMDNPMLLGQNTLEDGNFIIDPKMNESTDIDWQLVGSEIQAIKPPKTQAQSTEHIDEQRVRNVYETLREADVTFEDIIRVIRNDTLRTMENITY